MPSHFQKISFFFLIHSLSLFGATPSLTWDAPTTLYSSADFNGVLPKLVVDPSLTEATIAWIASGDSTTIYSSTYKGAWESEVVISASMNPQSSLKITQDPSHTLFAVWNMQVGSNIFLQSAVSDGMGWSEPETIQDLGELDLDIALQLTTADDGVFLLSWQDFDDNAVGVAYLLGTFSSPFFINSEELYVLQSQISKGEAIFATSDGVFRATIVPDNPSSALTTRTSFPRTIVTQSLDLNVSADFSRAVFVFQDEKTKFLIAAIDDGENAKYTTISIPDETVIVSRVSISPIDYLPAVVWQLASGKIKAARFDGHRWVNHTTLSQNGSSPDIDFNPISNHPVIVWADFEAGGTSNSIKTAEFNRSNWTSPLSISLGGYTLSDAQVDIAQDGQAFATWSRTPTSGAKSLIETAKTLP